MNNREIKKLVRKALLESHEMRSSRYMFFSNLEQIKRQCDLLLEADQGMIEQILENGHDWAQDHVAEAKNNLDQVFDFIMNETNVDFDATTEMNEDGFEDMAMAYEAGGGNPDEALAMSMMEGRKKTGTKLCARGKAAAKAKFKIYPSAYSNGFAVQVCQGRMKGLDGKKKCSPPYC